MQTKSNFRVRVMTMAHNIFKSIDNKLNWSECLKKAWRLYYLAKAMRQGIVHFTYYKVGGQLRQAFGTLCNLPVGVTSHRGGKKAPSYKTMCYFDTDKQQFRSFRVENFVSVVA